MCQRAALMSKPVEIPICAAWIRRNGRTKDDCAGNHFHRHLLLFAARIPRNSRCDYEQPARLTRLVPEPLAGAPEGIPRSRRRRDRRGEAGIGAAAASQGRNIRPLCPRRCDVLAIAMNKCIGIMRLLNGCRIRPRICGPSAIRGALTDTGRSIPDLACGCSSFDNADVKLQ